MVKEQKWPDNLVLVRHGKTSTSLKKGKNQLMIRSKVRDMDRPLIKEGVIEAKAVGKELQKYPKFDFIFSSPNLHCIQTAEQVVKQLGYKPKIIVEERIREKERGIFWRLLELGRKKFYPREVEREKWEGEYYYRPPGGENYPDVAMRVHSLLSTLVRDYSKKNVLIVTHSTIIVQFRKLLERMTEAEVLETIQKNKVRHSSITHFVYDKRKNKLFLKTYNFRKW